MIKVKKRKKPYIHFMYVLLCYVCLNRKCNFNFYRNLCIPIIASQKAPFTYPLADFASVCMTCPEI